MNFSGKDGAAYNDVFCRSPRMATFEAWLLVNPPPDLHDLVAQYGRWDQIPPEALTAHQEAMKAWQAKYRDRHRAEVEQEAQANPPFAYLNTLPAVTNKPYRKCALCGNRARFGYYLNGKTIATCPDH